MISGEFRTKLAAALRSGEYRQGTGALKRNGCFCILGVACDVAGVEWSGPDSQGYETAIYRGEAADCSLPEVLRKDLGLSPIAHEALMANNDQYILTFNEFATEIELGSVISPSSKRKVKV